MTGAVASNESYKSFPPGSRHLAIPTSSRRAALAGLSLYTPCRGSAIWAHRLAWQAVSIFGPKVIPGSALSWAPPIEPKAWNELCERWRRDLGAFDSMAVLRRTQPERSGVMLLLLQLGIPVSFVKVSMERDEFENEARALALLSGSRPASFLAPRLLGRGECGAWRYLATSPLPPGPHRPPSDPPIGQIVAEIQTALATLPRPAATPDPWRPMHGDLTPWNLRRTADSALVLIDWEEAAWGPPGADEVLYRVTATALRLGPLPRLDAAEAIRFWEDRISRRTAVGERDRRLKESVLTALRGLAAQQPDR